MTSEDFNKTVWALVLQYATTHSGIVAASANWLKSVDTGLLASLFSTRKNHVVNEEKIMAEPTPGNKPIPE